MVSLKRVYFKDKDSETMHKISNHIYQHNTMEFVGTNTSGKTDKINIDSFCLTTIK